MDVMLDKISQSLEVQNITFEPENQRVRCLAHVINLAARKLIDCLVVQTYDDEDACEAANDDDDNLKDAIYKVINITAK